MDFGFIKWYNDVPSFVLFTLIVAIILMLFDCCWVLKCFHRVIYHTIKSYSCLVTASSEPTILQVNFDCLLLPNCITWQLPKMCIICHFWQITQSEIILHTALAFKAVTISVAFRKPSDFTVCSFYLTIYQTQASSCDVPCFENCCILLIYLPILGLCLSCLCLCAPFGEGLYQKLCGNSRKPHQL